jgi:enoyl-CoA hydratase
MADLKHWILEKGKEKDAGIVWLKLNRVDKKNAFNREVAEELYTACLSIKDDKSVRVMVITSVMDEMFSAGADIEWFYGVGGPEGKEISERVHVMFGILEELPFPVICVVKGLNLTAGVEMMYCCDIIIAADNAKFGQIETKYGLTPGGGGTQRLTRLVGVLKAKELIYAARIIDAKEALRIGLVNEVFPLAEVDAAVKKLCLEIMKNSQRAIKESKSLIQKAVFDLASDKGYKQEERVFGEDFASGEPRERFGKYLQKN